MITSTQASPQDLRRQLCDICAGRHAPALRLAQMSHGKNLEGVLYEAHMRHGTVSMAAKTKQHGYYARSLIGAVVYLPSGVP